MATAAMATSADATGESTETEYNPISSVFKFCGKIHTPKPVHEFDYCIFTKTFVCTVNLTLQNGKIFKHKSSKHNSKKDAKKDAFKSLHESLKDAWRKGVLRPNVTKNIEEQTKRSHADPICKLYYYLKRIFRRSVYPKFDFKLTKTGFRCTVTIPMGDMMTELAGNDRRKKNQAKRSACEMALEHLEELFPKSFPRCSYNDRSYAGHKRSYEYECMHVLT